MMMEEADCLMKLPDITCLELVSHNCIGNKLPCTLLPDYMESHLKIRAIFIQILNLPSAGTGSWQGRM
jgi:hypothetical protein